MKVTCILPVRNGERFLEEALRSVLDQDDGELDVLVVDDGSTDATPRILDGFRSRIRVIPGAGAGVAAARNLALGTVHDGLVAFQDADDVWQPGKLALQKAAFAGDPSLDYCVGMVQNFWMEEVAHEARGYRGTRFAEPVPGYFLPAILATRALFDRVGLFDTSLRVGSDNDWFVRAKDAGARDRLLPELLVRRRLHSSNLTRADLASRESLLRNLKASLERRRAPTDA